MVRAQPSENTLLLAVTAVHAWGCFVEMLGHEFLRRDPPVGQPMLKVKHLYLFAVHNWILTAHHWILMLNYMLRSPSYLQVHESNTRPVQVREMQAD